VKWYKESRALWKL